MKKQYVVKQELHKTRFFYENNDSSSPRWRQQPKDIQIFRLQQSKIEKCSKSSYGWSWNHQIFWHYYLNIYKNYKSVIKIQIAKLQIEFQAKTFQNKVFFPSLYLSDSSGHKVTAMAHSGHENKRKSVEEERDRDGLHCTAHRCKFNQRTVGQIGPFWRRILWELHLEKSGRRRYSQ